MPTVTESREFRIEETGERVNSLELELHLFFGVWAVIERHEDRWVVATDDGERRTLVVMSD
ncbi:hypothetical protein HISP_09480 [Haloarcula hispanica N601]|uniref:Uncharacterized protein n=3 Tax=Haloarcula hispanica TaxID=51589 RepID=V5TMN9_HALHI|nr:MULTISPECIES: hypothetical protein [Haloarcula]AEM57458.1 conserved hypothetical protein [Haloarcula hispanica ATCC 33960]AHB66222.1 hypothetical protein HISP_09480 [Haloarcula hispanica N601]AJF24537.1 hypothetical protein SG26_01835 [Haloarcula sp. CBA1115]KAA9406846.1 hypothetical protein Har1131_08530 [Haloarcula sp. CBA1131]KAA9410118.1 hypothetical protein EGO51_09985 [Haloarcula hispanica]